LKWIYLTSYIRQIRFAKTIRLGYHRAETEFWGRTNGLRFFSKAQEEDFSQKFDFSFRFFNRSLAKLRRTPKRPTVLSSLLNMLTNSITLRKIYFLTKFWLFFAKNGKNQNFVGLNANTRYDTSHSDFYFFYGSQKAEFLGRKIGFWFF